MTSGEESDQLPVYSETFEEQLELASAIAGEFPGGSLVAHVIQGVVARRQNRRLNEFLQGLQNDIKELDEKVNDAFIGSDEYVDLVEEIVSGAADTRQEEKLEAYRNLFLNTVTRDEPSFDEAAEISSLVARWQPSHILFLRDLATKHEIRSSPMMRTEELSEGGIRKKVLRKLARYLNWEPEDVQRIWFELRASGVVEERTTRRRQWEEDRIEMRLTISSFGVKVVEFLSREPASS